jgi:exopolyphosphatase/guanosine-5'-triphosphate,3'-diphosphate pyrophosphatase
VDIGGGSIGIAVGAGTEALFTANLPLGALRLSEQMEMARVGKADRLAWVKKRIHEGAASAIRQIADLDPEVIVLNSGTAHAVRELVMRDTFQPGRLGRLDETSLMFATDEAMRASDRKLVARGIHPRGTDVIRVAMVTILSLMEMLRVDRVEVSDRGLRDGVILREYRRIRTSESSGVHRRPSGLWKWMVERAS